MGTSKFDNSNKIGYNEDVFMVAHCFIGCVLLIVAIFFPHVIVLADDSSLFGNDIRYRSAHYWTYVDKTGKLITDRKFDTAQDFSEGLAAIRVGDRVGYMDRNGIIVIQPVFCDGGPFTEGLAYVSLTKECAHIINYENADNDAFDLVTVTFAMFPMQVRMLQHEYGYINNKGTIVFKPKFGIARSFREGYALVAFEGQWRYMDRTGNFLPGFSTASVVLPTNFSEGLAAAPSNDNYKWVVFDKAGKTVFNIRGEYVNSFSDGFAKVSRPSSISNNVMYIGRNGEFLGNFIVEDGGSFSEGLAPVYSHSCWNYIDKAGKDAFKWCLESAQEFSEGLAAVKFKGKWGFLDKAGKMKIKPTFEDARKFSEGLAAIKSGGKWGYIDSDGRIQIKPFFTEARDFSEGRTAVAMSRAHK